MSYIKNNYKKLTIVVSILLIISLFIFIFMKKAHAELVPNKYVEIKSKNSEYVPENNPIGWNYTLGIENTGGWRVAKHARWTDYGVAELKLDISATPRYSKKKQDIIVVINNTNSNAMPSGNYEKLKDKLREFSKDHIDNEKGKIALISFNSYANIVSDFTDNYDDLETDIYSLPLSNNTSVSYYQPLLKVDELLRNYTPSNNTEVVVIFVAGIAPNIESPLEVGEYEYLTDQYPYLTVNSINYSSYAFHAYAGAFIPTANKSLAKISREMINASLDRKDEHSTYEMVDNAFQNPFLMAARSRIIYDVFDISEYINNDYFDVESVEDITNRKGKVKLETENGTQKVLWTMKDERFSSGTPSYTNELVIKLKLKDELLDKGGIYPTSSRSIVKTSMQDTPNENINTTATTILPDNFRVIYDGNAPSGCNVKGVPNADYHSVFATIKVSEAELSCDGYIFEGWDIVDKKLTMINDDTFLMPESDVTIRANWSKLSIKKSMDGDVNTARSLYDIMKEKAVPDNIDSEFVSNEGLEYWWRYQNRIFNGILYDHFTYQDIYSNDEHKDNWNGKGVYLFSDTKDEKYPLLFYRGYVDDNNVLFGNVCWKMMNTTPTGGVKLIFNGFYTGNACVTTSPSATFGPAPFTYIGGEPKFGSASYMYGKTYDYATAPSYNYTMLSTPINSYETESFSSYNNDQSYPNGKRIYGRSIKYYPTATTDEYGYHYAKSYFLLDTFTIDDDSIPEENGGIYTCRVGTRYGGTSCSYADYIISYENRNLKRIYLTGAGDLSYYNKEVYIGDNYTKNSDGTYTLTNPVKYDGIELFKKLQNFDSNESLKNKYFCMDKSATCDASKGPIKILMPNLVTTSGPNVGTSSYYGLSVNVNYVYGKDVEYKNGTYKLKDTINLFDSKINNISLDEYIYTCGTLEDTCDKVKVLTKDGWIILTDGDKLDDIMPNIRANTNSSVAKGQMDSFYQSYILNNGLSDYVEDTVYCNDRSDFMMRTIEYRAMLDNYSVIDGFKPKITCPKEDSFTVSDSIGNGALTYPVGLPSYDEMVLAGSNGFIRNTSYLSNNLNWWTMTPYTGHQIINNNSASSNADYGYIYAQNANTTSYASYRPVISIKSTVSVNGGDGTAAHPYILK